MWRRRILGEFVRREQAALDQRPLDGGGAAAWRGLRRPGRGGARDLRRDEVVARRARVRVRLRRSDGATVAKRYSTNRFCQYPPGEPDSTDSPVREVRKPSSAVVVHAAGTERVAAVTSLLQRGCALAMVPVARKRLRATSNSVAVARPRSRIRAALHSVARVRSHHPSFGAGSARVGGLGNWDVDARRGAVLPFSAAEREDGQMRCAWRPARRLSPW